MRTRKPPLALLCALPFIASCEPPVPQDEVIDIVFDPCEPVVFEVKYATTDEQLERIQQALDMWNELLGSKLTLEEIEHAPRVPLEFDQAARAFRGYYDDELGVIYINDKLEGREITITTAHEIGHIFGLFHVEATERDSVMNHGNLEHAPNESDAEAVDEIWGDCSGEAGVDVNVDVET